MVRSLGEGGCQGVALKVQSSMRRVFAEDEISGEGLCIDSDMGWKLTSGADFIVCQM